MVLWRALGAKDVQIAAKDAQLIKSTEVVTQALAASAAANSELRRIIEAWGLNQTHIHTGD